VKRSAALIVALLMPLLAARVTAASAYVSDELVLGVYAEANGQGQRLTTLHSGASVGTLAVNGEFTQVRLNDGTTGWVKSTYLTTREPATSRVKQLEEELDRSRATTPALAEAAAHSEVERLKRDLAAKQSEVDAARAASAGGTPAGGAGGATLGVASPGTGVAPVATVRADATGAAGAALVSTRMAILAVVVALAFGFWLGYATLARRVRHKFGGIKVY
jgi:hypothetical protein